MFHSGEEDGNWVAGYVIIIYLHYITYLSMHKIFNLNWKACTVVKNTPCSCKRLKFSYHHSH